MIARDRDRPIIEERTRRLQRFLAASGIDPASTRVLDIGCGAGRVLQSLLTLGFHPAHLTGVDLIPDRVEAARRLLPPETRVYCADASREAFTSEAFHLVLLFTVLSSIRDDGKRAAVAARAWQALRPGGAIVIYDMRVPSPLNPEVAPVTAGEVRRLFPAGLVQRRSLTVAPPVGRVFHRLYALLASLPFLRTHNLHYVRKPGPVG